MSDFETVAALLEARLRSLDEYNIPLTLAHGDLPFSKVGFQEKAEENTERAIFFDWQFAAISHPLFDFHLMYEELSDLERDQYLRTWCDYVSMDRLREAYNMAHPLGWLLKLRGIKLAMHHPMPERDGELEAFFGFAWGIMSNQLTIKELRQDYSQS